MIERLWRYDALRVHLLSHIGVVVASAVVLVAGQPATAQYTSDFEAPLYAGSANGTVITGQDNFYIPVPDSQDGLVYTYAGNALGLPGNPSGGGTQFAGVTGGDTGLPVPFARAQRDVVYGNGTGVWTVSFDIAATYIGDLPSAQNIGSFSTQVFDANATFIALATWTDPDTAANWNAGYVWYNAAGQQVNEAVNDPGFQTLLIDHWYRWSTTFNLDTNQIVEVSITDLTNGTTVTNHPVDRFLTGGAAGGAAPPNGFRLFGGSSTAAGNTLGFDNVDINLRPDPPSGGACCFLDQTCEFLTEEECAAADGIYQGDWSGCTDVGCTPIPEECNKDAGPCNEPNGTPGCNMDLCCALVCNLDPFCCGVKWDASCVDLADEFPQCLVVEVPEGFFLNPVEFQDALNKAGKVLKGFEDYPWEAADGSVIGVDDPLDVNTSVPDWIQPGVLLDNVTYQSNEIPFGAGGPMPGPIQPGLALFTPGFIGATNTGLVANHFVDSFDIISGPPAGDNHTAIAMTIVSFNNASPGGTITVTVYDKDENVLGAASNLAAPVASGLFLGILFPGDATIGRVNLYDTTPGFDAEGVYDLTVYVLDGDCPWDLDGTGDVGVGDLLILLANWGNPYGVPDLLQMLAAWGACP